MGRAGSAAEINNLGETKDGCRVEDRHPGGRNRWGRSGLKWTPPNCRHGEEPGSWRHPGVLHRVLKASLCVTVVTTLNTSVHWPCFFFVNWEEHVNALLHSTSPPTISVNMSFACEQQTWIPHLPFICCYCNIHTNTVYTHICMYIWPSEDTTSHSLGGHHELSDSYSLMQYVPDCLTYIVIL